MKDDDFLTQFRKRPRPEFAEELYRRISQPMNTTTSWTGLPRARRTALALALLTLFFAASLLFSPAARALAGDILRQIGAISVAPIPENGPIAPEATAVPQPGGSSQQAGSMAEAARLAGFALQAPTYLPEGYAPASDWSVMPQGEGVLVARRYHAGDHFLYFNAYRYGPNDQFDQGLSPQEAASEVTVGDRAGLWITGRLMAHPEQEPSEGEPRLLPTNWLMWEEAGVNYTLFGDELPLEEALRIAEGLDQ